MKRLIIVCLLLLLAAGCTAGTGSTSTGAQRSSTTTTQSKPKSSTDAAPAPKLKATQLFEEAGYPIEVEIGSDPIERFRYQDTGKAFTDIRLQTTFRSLKPTGALDAEVLWIREHWRLALAFPSSSDRTCETPVQGHCIGFFGPDAKSETRLNPDKATPVLFELMSEIPGSFDDSELIIILTAAGFDGDYEEVNTGSPVTVVVDKRGDACKVFGMMTGTGEDVDPTLESSLAGAACASL